MRFHLQIQLGNDAMRDGADIAKALRRAADVLENRTEAGLLKCASKIWDINGNTVGGWSVHSNRKER